jgi:hypothetical protein
MYNRYIGNTGKYYRVDDSTAGVARAAGSGVAGGEAVRRGGLESILSPGGNLDMGDIILLALLFLLYTESGDYEFLIILGFLAFAILKGSRGNRYARRQDLPRRRFLPSRGL